MKGRDKGIVISYIYIIVNTLAGLFMSSFLIMKLGDIEYGLYQTIASFANGLVLLQFGTGTVMTRNISMAKTRGNEEDVNRNFSTIFVISLVLSCLMIIISLIFYLLIDDIYIKTMNIQQINYVKKIFLILVGYIVFSFLVQSFDGVLIAEENYTFTKAFALVKVLIRTTLIVVVVLFCSYSINIAIVDLFLSGITFCFTGIYCVKKYKLHFSLKYFNNKIFIASVPLCFALFLQTITNQANSNVDKFLIGIMMDMTSVSIYSVGQYIYMMFSTILTIPITMYIPLVVQNMSNGIKDKELTKELLPACRITATIGAFVLGGFFAIGKPFVECLYGQNKTESWILALIVMIPTYINMTDSVIINVLDVANKRLVRSLVLIGATIMNVILTIVFIDKIGMIGAVIATALTMIMGEILIMNIYYQKVMKIDVWYLFKNAYKGLLGYIIFASVIGYLISNNINNDIMAMLLGGSVYVIISIGLIYKFGLNLQEKNTVNRYLNRFIK